MPQVVKNNLPLFHLLTRCPEHQPHFLLETATPEQIPVLQAATILVAMVSGKNFRQPKFWRKSGDGDHFTVKGR